MVPRKAGNSPCVPRTNEHHSRSTVLRPRCYTDSRRCPQHSLLQQFCIACLGILFRLCEMWEGQRKGVLALTPACVSLQQGRSRLVSRRVAPVTFWQWRFPVLRLNFTVAEMSCPRDLFSTEIVRTLCPTSVDTRSSRSSTFQPSFCTVRTIRSFP